MLTQATMTVTLLPPSESCVRAEYTDVAMPHRPNTVRGRFGMESNDC
jgi:hypothetical protein